jgi:hypothetical protein
MLMAGPIYGGTPVLDGYGMNMKMNMNMGIGPPVCALLLILLIPSAVVRFALVLELYCDMSAGDLLGKDVLWISLKLVTGNSCSLSS